MIAEAEEVNDLVTNKLKEAKILVVDDFKEGREAIANFFEQDMGYQVYSPGSPEELEEAITFHVFDSVLADADLSHHWEMPEEIIDSKVRNGADVAVRYLRLHKMSPGCVYSTHVKLRGPEYDRIFKDIGVDLDMVFIPKLDSLDFEENKTKFTPFLLKTQDYYRSNPLFQHPSYADEPPAVQLHVYRRVYQMHAEWINLNLKLVGDCSWGVICGRDAQRDCYGRSLNGGTALFKVVKRPTYPTREEFKVIADREESFPFVFWNTRKPEFLRLQFEQAGPGLEHIPVYLHNFFGVAMSRPLADAYDAGERDEALGLCRRLNHTGQVETVKQIYRRARGNDARVGDLRARCREAGLPRVVESYQARVGGIEGQVAFVEIRDWGSDRARSLERFDAEKLRKLGITRKNQVFEYLVYELPNGNPSMDIEPIERGA
jgi:hypothetical protein